MGKLGTLIMECQFGCPVVLPRREAKYFIMMVWSLIVSLLRLSRKLDMNLVVSLSRYEEKLQVNNSI